MPTTAYYEKIIATMPIGLEKQVLTILKGETEGDYRD
jgi:hypothetical protein